MGVSGGFHESVDVAGEFVCLCQNLVAIHVVLSVCGLTLVQSRP